MEMEESIWEVTLERMVHGGEALGFYQGRAVFVEGALPGERVRVHPIAQKSRWVRARLLEVITPSPDRIDPPCPYFGECGGCQWQHATYTAQLRYKEEIVREQLTRLGKIADPPVRPVLGMEEPWAYRNHVQMVAAPEGYLGFYAAGSHTVVPIESCMLMHPLLDELWEALDLEWPTLRRISLRAGIRTGDRMLIFETEDDEAAEITVDFPLSCVLLLSDGQTANLIGRNYIWEEVAGRRFRISATSFFQVNTEQADHLVATVRELLEPRPYETLLDLYSGVGVFGLCLAEEVGQVIGVEIHPDAIADAQANATGMDHVQFYEGRAEELLPTLDLDRVDLAVLDPPRSGCERPALEALVRLVPRRIAYVSCDPATMARDATHLQKAGYHLRTVQPIDMFPQTYHIESVALWER